MLCSLALRNVIFFEDIWHNVMSNDPSLLKKTEKHFYTHFFKHDTLNCYTFHDTLHFYLFLSQLFWDVFLYKNTKFVRIYKTQSCWSVKTLENVSLYFCQLIKG